MIRKRGRSYGVSVYSAVEKKKVWVGTRPTLKEARALERKTTDEFATNRPAARSVREFATTWQQICPRPEATTNRHNASMMRGFVAEYGDRRLDAIPRPQAKAFATRKPHVARVAAAMFNDAIDLGHFAGPNPFARLGLEQSRGRKDLIPLTEDDLERLGDLALEHHGAYGPTFRAMILFAAYVGLRPGELFALRWDDLDLRALEVRIDRQVRPDGLAAPKTKKARTVILPPPARDALATIPRGIEWLFTTPTGKRFSKGSHRYYWEPVRRAFGRPTLAFYELRHMCGSHLADLGLSSRDIAHQLGNSARVCEETYIHSYEDRARARLHGAFNKPVPLRPVVSADANLYAKERGK